MKYLLKYLFLAITALLLWNCPGESESAVSEERHLPSALAGSVYHADISAPLAELCLPSQANLSGAQRVHNTSRRTNCTHRSNSEFAKSSRGFNAGLIYHIQKKSIIVHSSHIDPANRLLCLGQLII